ncbi:MAG: hypothetical protein VW667_00650 [Candidatus Neomarinimicrobiota bacterium]
MRKIPINSMSTFLLSGGILIAICMMAIEMSVDTIIPNHQTIDRGSIIVG